MNRPNVLGPAMRRMAKRLLREKVLGDISKGADHVYYIPDWGVRERTEAIKQIADGPPLPLVVEHRERFVQIAALAVEAIEWLDKKAKKEK